MVLKHVFEMHQAAVEIYYNVESGDKVIGLRALGDVILITEGLLVKRWPEVRNVFLIMAQWLQVMI